MIGRKLPKDAEKIVRKLTEQIRKPNFINLAGSINLMGDAEDEISGGWIKEQMTQVQVNKLVMDLIFKRSLAQGINLES